MAQVHNQLARYTELSKGVRNALGLAEGGLERVSETLQPVMPLFERTEWAYPRGEWIGTALYNIGAGGAATYASWGVGIAPGSGLIAVLDARTQAMEVSGGAGAVYVYVSATYAAFAAALAGAAGVYCIDSRANPIAAPNVRALPVIGRSGTPAAVPGSGLGLLSCNSATPLNPKLPLDIVITPGWAVILSAATANTALSIQPVVRCRVAVPGELEASA